MKYFRSFIFLTAFLSLALHGQAQKAAAAKTLIKRTYYDYQGRQLHEEYQYIKTANQLVVKHGYYKEYDENGVIQKKYFFAKGLENGVCTDYGDFGDGKGPQPFIVTTYKMGVRHGYTAQWRTDDNNPRHFKSHEGHFYNDRTDGRRVSYELDGSKLVENWYQGARQGKTVEYDAAGNPTREAYYENGQPFTGSVEELFDTDTLKSSDSYEQGMRAGLSQTWYASGRLRSQTRYRDGRQSGPTMHYLETGEPDLATRTALGQMRADSINQAQTKDLATKQAVAARRRQDSLQVAETRTRELRQKAYTQELEQGSRADAMVRSAERQQEEMRVSATAGYRPHLQAKLYMELYAKLLTEVEASRDPGTRLAKSERLYKLLQLAVDLESGKNQDLNKAIRNENDLDKVLALTGI